MQVPPVGLLPALAQLYGAPETELAWMAEVCTSGFLAWAEDLPAGGEVLGAVGTRPSPHHGAELVGGAFPGPAQVVAALSLAQAAREEVGRVYAFADGTLFPPAELLAAGFREVGAYRRLAGRVPYRHHDLPGGVQLRPLADVPDQEVRLQALRTYEDRIGHHAVNPQAALDGAGGFDSHLSLIALDSQGRGVGICRVALEGGEGRLDSPGVHPDWRHTALRGALLGGVNARLRHQGVTRLSVDSWGDTPAELAHDLKLGLHVTDETPILASG
ncbi:hypothetical protein [Deinococcus koreensis]|uniref:hypothetical protein n=1 Tax=Deinococcus koreensis TaxID=2054903 RepID=UPI001FAE8CCF|nr:hypothetical protein [Deinococcus koreensis]